MLAMIYKKYLYLIRLLHQIAIVLNKHEIIKLLFALISEFDSMQYMHWIELRFENTIQIGKRNGYYTLAVMLDLEKAFDLLWVKGLLFKLYEMGVRGKMLSWIRDFLSHRKFQVQIASQRSTLRDMPNGSPQGSILSPLLFIILTNDLEATLSSSLTGWYADDFVLWKKHRNLSHLKKKVEEDLARIIKILKTWGFRVAAPKTTAMIFGNHPVLKKFLHQR